MAGLMRGALLAIPAACLLYAAPAAAGAHSKSGCDGQRANRAARFSCAQEAVARPGLHATRMHDGQSAASNSDIVVAATAQNRECAILSCPQFLLVGVGY